MPRWQRSPIARSCGLCGKAIDAGDPVLLVTSLELPRCSLCAAAAGHTVDLAALDAGGTVYRRGRPERGFSRASTGVTLPGPRDGKAAALGREDGDE